MSQDYRPIETFVGRVRRRLNIHRLWTTLVWMVVAAAAALAVAGIWYTVRGYAVPRGEMIVLAAIALFGGAIVWTFRRLNREGAAREADRLFGLRDATTSFLHFSKSGCRDGFYALQAEQTCQRIEPLDPQSIKYEPPRRGIALAACLLAIAIPLGLRGPSEARVREQQLADETAVATAAINERLEEIIKELEEAAPNEEEKELLKPNQMRE